VTLSAERLVGWQRQDLATGFFGNDCASTNEKVEPTIRVRQDLGHDEHVADIDRLSAPPSNALGPADDIRLDKAAATRNPLRRHAPPVISSSLSQQS